MKIKSREIDRQMRLVGELLRRFSPLGSETIQRMLSPVSDKALSLLRLKHLNCEKVYIKRRDGSDMRVCVMRSGETSGKRTGILWFHGGGYVLGAPEMALISFPRHLIKRCNCVIISPDYTLSAKAEYPAAFNDACDALEWMLKNKKILGFDGNKIVVGGESAGGGLAAAVSIYARDKKMECIAFQMPLYPMLSDRVTETSADNDAPVWNTAANQAAWKIYLGDRVMNNSVSPYAAPARETDLSNLPPLISAVGTVDPFYSENLVYFNHLKKSGVRAEYFVGKGCYHAFDMMAPYAQVSKRAVDFLINAFNDYADKYL